jgi:outer membrane lipoprotein-sorting protein
MKTFHSIRFAALFGVVAVFALNGSAQAPASAQSIFDSMVQALGGKAYLDVKEIQVTGRYFTFRRNNEVGGSELYADFIKFPDMERTEFGREKEKRIEIHRGREGWKVTPPVKGKIPDIQPMSASETRQFLDAFKTSFDYVPRFVVNTPKTTLVNAGTELVEYKRTDVLEVRDAEKNLIRIYVDRATHLPVKTQNRDADESTVREETYANWHKFDGVMTPLTVVRYKDGVKYQEIHAEKVVYNPGFPDSLFAEPPRTAK